MLRFITANGRKKIRCEDADGPYVGGLPVRFTGQGRGGGLLASCLLLYTAYTCSQKKAQSILIMLNIEV